MEVLEAIGGITFFFFVIYLLKSNEDRKKEAYKRYVDFLGLGDEKLLFNEYFSQNKHMAYEQAVRKFYSKATNYERASNLMKEHLETIKEIDDLEKKQYTIKRVFAYDYEDFFYSLFSPYAKYSNLTGWSIYSDSIPKDYIINKLAEWKKVIYGLVLSVVLGFAFGYFITKLIENIFKNFDRRKTLPFFKKFQVFSGGAMAFMHGAQDGQKFIGIFLLVVSLANGVTNTRKFYNTNMAYAFMFCNYDNRNIYWRIQNN